MSYIFAPDKTYSIPINGESAEFPVHRIFCVGRNYAAHAAEMSAKNGVNEIFFFTKTPRATTRTGAAIPYPPGTENLHYEIELALFIDKPIFQANPLDARKAIYGYACALDMTRRDLQLIAREQKRPWDIGKNFDNSAIFGSITKAANFKISTQQICLKLNGEIKQDATLAEMLWNEEEIIATLSQYYHLCAGDVILTGTPSGVGPVRTGDKIVGSIDGLAPVELNII